MEAAMYDEEKEIEAMKCRLLLKFTESQEKMGSNFDKLMTGFEEIKAMLRKQMGLQQQEGSSANNLGFSLAETCDSPQRSHGLNVEVVCDSFQGSTANKFGNPQDEFQPEKRVVVPGIAGNFQRSSIFQQQTPISTHNHHVSSISEIDSTIIYGSKIDARKHEDEGQQPKLNLSSAVPTSVPAKTISDSTPFCYSSLMVTEPLSFCLRATLNPTETPPPEPPDRVAVPPPSLNPSLSVTTTKGIAAAQYTSSGSDLFAVALLPTEASKADKVRNRTLIHNQVDSLLMLPHLTQVCDDYTHLNPNDPKIAEEDLVVRWILRKTWINLINRLETTLVIYCVYHDLSEDINFAIQMFNQMPRCLVGGRISLNTSCLNNGHRVVACDLFINMHQMEVKSGNYIFSSMLSLFFLELLNYGRQVYSAGIIACEIFSVQEFPKRYKIPFVGTRASEFTTIVLDLESGSVFCPVALLLNEMKLQFLGSIVPHVYLWFSALASFSGSSASSVNLEAKTDVVKNRTMGHNYVNSPLMLSCFPQSCGHYLFPAYGSEIVWRILVCKWKNVYPIIMILGRAVTGKIMPVNTVFAEKYVLFMALDSFAEVYEGGNTVKNEFSRQTGHLFISTLVVGVGLCTTFYFLLLLVTTVTITAKGAVFVYEELVLWGCRMGLVSTKRLEQQIENTGNFMVVITLNVVIYHGEIGAAAASQLEKPPNLVISQMFHVPQLKICTAPVFVTAHFLPMPSLPVLKWENSVAIFHRKTIDRGRIHVAAVLLKWNTLPPKHGTWKYSSLRTRMLEGEGIVTGYFTYMVLLLLFVSIRMGGGNSNAILLPI